MMATSTPCIICSGVIRRNNSDKPNGYDKALELLQRFIKLLGRHLDNHDARDEDDPNTRISFENFIDAGLLSCKECSKVVESFCELYHQMKCAELRLNWKLRILIDLMSNTDKMPNAKYFENETGSPTEQGTESFKSALVKKCARILQATFPRVVVNKHRYRYLNPHNKLSDHHKPIPSDAKDTMDDEPDGGDSDSCESKTIPMVDPNETMSRLRIVHRCNKCLKTFSSMGKLNEHELSHENEDLSNWSDDDDDASECEMSDTDTRSDYNYQDGFAARIINIVKEPPAFDFASCVTPNISKLIGVDQENEGVEPPRNTASAEVLVETSKKEVNLAENGLQKKIVQLKKMTLLVSSLAPPSTVVELEKRSTKQEERGNKSSSESREIGERSLTNSPIGSADLSEELEGESCVNDVSDTELRSNGQDDVTDAEKVAVTVQKSHAPNSSVILSRTETSSIKAPLINLVDKESSSDQKKEAPPPPVILKMSLSSSSKSADIRIESRRKSSIDPITGRYNCSLCSTDFKTIFSFDRHFKITHLGVRYKCPLCESDYSDRSYYLNHYRTIHMGHKFKCDICNRLFNENKKLNKHRKRRHLKEKPDFVLPRFPKNPETGRYHCTLCPTHFSKEPSCQDHYKYIHLECKHKCSNCGEEFPSRGDLHRHRQKVHRNVTISRVECPKCKKSFAGNHTLKLHQRMTSCGAGLGLKPIPKAVCHLCGEEFAWRNSLKQHVKLVHATERTCQCELCGKKFKTRECVRTHQKGVHLGMKLNKSKKKGNSDL